MIMKVSGNYCIVIWWFLSAVDAFPRRNYDLHVPMKVRPILPDIVEHSSGDLDTLQRTGQDPEVFNYWRLGLRWDRYPEKLWSNRTVPYVISPLYSPEDYVTIYKAISYMNYMTCVNFVPWDEKAKDFVLIWPIKYPKGCWSFIGKFGGGQLLSLQPPDERGPNCLGNEGRAVHELLHALGIFHEQSRADRDNFVTIQKENIISNFQINFEKESLENTTYSYEYDYSSIMHYGSDYFSKSPGKPTIIPTMAGAIVGQRRAMSKTDCLKVNELYGCLDNSIEARRWNNICTALGL
ncbi:zinc metalloproteinase nas-15 isoform X2 [Fopius arisanus]|uniref:Metalloendopeptidase n=1 Tax=Fopius arisanus TaxID=64838 RepID=A0A9R1TK39_9HYME|nr:PREDICTED: zinc metalloproteinase nas-15 isoform X2 [Fopius arisanus]